MTMFEDINKYLNNKALLKKIFKILNLDIDFPIPTKSRRSGKTTHSNIILICCCIKGDIKKIIYEKRRPFDYKGLEKTVWSYHHNRPHTKRQKEIVSYVLKSLNIKIDEAYNYIKILD